ncbi:coiled-coil domain-containing protein 86-like isoform X3 [Gorilla gorilla gorilla]|uniref:coiled-coil domain-containing protein 86-like isoform X3 n=1 Tax=Gorilla gorilla gorilla TaxID=9595 RepID=UPI00300BB9D6
MESCVGGELATLVCAQDESKAAASARQEFALPTGLDHPLPKPREPWSCCLLSSSPTQGSLEPALRAVVSAHPFHMLTRAFRAMLGHRGEVPQLSSYTVPICTGSLLPKDLLSTQPGVPFPTTGSLQPRDVPETQPTQQGMPCLQTGSLQPKDLPETQPGVLFPSTDSVQHKELPSTQPGVPPQHLLLQVPPPHC